MRITWIMGWIGSVLLFLASLYGQEKDWTAEEMLQAGQTAWTKGDFRAAEPFFSDFLTQYGAAKKAQQALPQVLSRLALSRIQQGKYLESLEPIEQYINAFPQGNFVCELLFWKGIGLFQKGETPQAIETLEAWIQRYPDDEKRLEAQWVLGTAWLEKEDWAQAEALFQPFAQQSNDSRQPRAQVFQMLCWLQQEKPYKAWEAAKTIDPSAAEGLALRQLLLLQLGQQLMEIGEPLLALRSFQLVWPQGKALSHQKKAISQREKELQQAQQKGDRIQHYALAQSLHHMEKERHRLEALTDHEIAWKFRMARCWSELNRWVEASLLLSDLAQQPLEASLQEHVHFSLMRSFLALKRWPQAIASAQAFSQAFPQSASIPLVLYWQGEAYQRSQSLKEADAVYEKFLSLYPQHELAHRVFFARAYLSLRQGKNEKALERFIQYPQKFPQGTLTEEVFYWQGVALAFAKKYEQARTCLAHYIEKYPQGKYEGEAHFRRAHALYAQRQFPEALEELQAFQRHFPEHPRQDESWVLLGDSYFATGAIEQGLAAFQHVSWKTPHLAEHAFFQQGKALRQTERWDEMAAHFHGFTQSHEESPRIVEALYWIAWVEQKHGHLDKARICYEQAIQRWGNDPRRSGVEDMFQGLAKLYRKKEERQRYLEQLRQWTTEALAHNQPTLAARSLWTQAQLLRRQEPTKHQSLLLQAATTILPEQGSPTLLADGGDALRHDGQHQKAQALYEGLLRWHPRSLLRDRSYAGLGLLAQAQNQRELALQWFDQFEKTNVQSPLLPEVLQAKADLLIKQGHASQAITELEKILTIKTARGRPWVQALTTIGDTYLKQNQPRKAIPYYQRVYLMYGKWPHYVAHAYFQSGQAFEQLQQIDAARRTYQELLSHHELTLYEETQQATARLEFLEKPLHQPLEEKS